MEPFRQPYRGGSAEPNNHDHGHGHEYSQDHHEQSKSLLNTQPSLFMPPPTTTTTTVGSQAYRDQVNRRSLLSPPSSTKSPPRSSTPTKDHPLVYRTRLIVRILSFILSAALVVVLSHAVSVYYSSKDADAFDISLQLTLPVWPRDMKMNPTLLLLGAASVATLLSGIICIASFSKVVSFSSSMTVETPCWPHLLISSCRFVVLPLPLPPSPSPSPSSPPPFGLPWPSITKSTTLTRPSSGICCLSPVAVATTPLSTVPLETWVPFASRCGMLGGVLWPLESSRY